jgi:hypothetical protein
MTGDIMPHVVAIAAPIGAGKTALVNALCRRLQDAAAIHYDRYEKATQGSAGRLRQWMEDGARFSDLPAPGLAAALTRLTAGEPIADPRSGETIRPGRWILFDMPLGRAHRKTSPFIDLLIWIDAPADLSLARKLKQYTGDFLRRGAAAEAMQFIGWMDGFLGHYLGVIHRVLQIQKTQVRADADVVLDGRLDVETLAEKAMAEIFSRLPDPEGPAGEASGKPRI